MNHTVSTRDNSPDGRPQECRGAGRKYPQFQLAQFQFDFFRARFTSFAHGKSEG
jgi:hypothetical protein